MAFTKHDITANRDYFSAKLNAEKSKHDAAQKAMGKPDAGDFLILDVRDRASFVQGHIKGALSVPLVRIKSLMGQLPKDRELVTYCYHQH